MAPWGWLALFLFGFVLLQVVLYRYFRRDGSAEERPSKHGARADTGRDAGRPVMDARFGPDNEDRTTGNDAGGIHCQHCGARNERDAEYTYCRQCAQPLQ